MCGSSIFDYIHSQDHAEFAEHTGLTLSNGRPLASPGEENAGPVGTHNPDGELRLGGARRWGAFYLAERDRVQEGEWYVAWSGTLG